jgi:nucleoid-associated protein YgaU
MIHKNSRYAKGVILYYDKTLQLTYLDFPKTFFEVDDQDYVYQVKEGDTLQSIANKHYGKPNLSWILLYANPNYLSELDVEPGDIINIPRTERVLEYVNGIR